MSKMIRDPKVYFSDFVPPRDEVLAGLEHEAQREGIPIVGPVVGELLFILARSMRARHILELGTATGYSAIYLARALGDGEGRVVTLENNGKMAQRARENLALAGLESRVEVLVGDAAGLMARMDETFDFIFMDIDKEGYVDALSHFKRLLRVGGLLVADNVGFNAARDFNSEIFGKPWLRTVHLLCHLPLHSPEDDGLSFAVRIE